MWTWILVGLVVWVMTSAAAGLTLARVLRARDHEWTRRSSRIPTLTG